MSFLGVGKPSGNVDNGKLDAAEAELDMVSDLFNRLVDVCHTKCITQKYNEGDLNKGESLCLDRCVAKYFAVHTSVGEVSQNRRRSR